AARRALWRVVAGFAILGALALVGVMCLLPILKYIVGKNFQPAFGVGPFVGVNLLAGMFFSAFVKVLFVSKRTRLIPVLTSICALTAIALNATLVPRFGLYGALASTGLAFGLRSALMARFALKALKNDTGVWPT